MKWLSKRRLLLGLGLGGILAAGAVAYGMRVPTAVTADDERVFERLLEGIDLPADRASLAWTREVDLIASIQRRVLEVAPENKGIPKNEPREPADLVEYGYGLCYDRSRVIEKALAHAGFEVRHLAAYALDGSKVGALVTPGHPSHALSEVRTSRGWMLVDSNSLYLGVDEDLEPISALDLLVCGDVRPQKDGHVDPLRGTLGSDFFFIYGLYSRHGGFYPPYVPVPDVSFGQLLDNFGSENARCPAGSRR
jgi:hypothetical protein